LTGIEIGFTDEGDVGGTIFIGSGTLILSV
jgi:hypothetical protein